MKKILYLFLLVSLITTVSCGGNKKVDADKNDTQEQKDASGIKNCDEFLDEYEAWMNDYLDLLNKYLKNPADPELAAKYMNLMQEAMTWSTKWVALVDCAEDEKYQERFEEIEKQAEEKLSELGID